MSYLFNQIMNTYTRFSLLTISSSGAIILDIARQSDGLAQMFYKRVRLKKWLYRLIQERSHSGLVQVFAKHPGCYSPREFESRPLRPLYSIAVD